MSDYRRYHSKTVQRTYGATTFLLVVLSLFSVSAIAQPCPANISIVTRAGSGFSGYLDGFGVETMFDQPAALGADKDGTIYVLEESLAIEFGRRRIRIVSNTGLVTTHPVGTVEAYSQLLVDSEGSLFLPQGTSIAKITKDGKITRIADDVTGHMALLGDGRFVIASENQIYVVNTSGEKTLLAGSGNRGSIDGRGIFCSFDQPRGIAVRADGAVVVSDNGGLRVITPDGVVTTIPGSAALAARTRLVVGKDGSIYGSRIAAGITVLRPSGLVESLNDCPNAGPNAWGAWGMCLLPDGDLAFANNYEPRIQILSKPSETPVDEASLQLAAYAGLTINGIAGRTYRIETAQIGNGEWKPISTNTIPQNVFRWIDPEPISSHRIYRAVLVQ